MAKVLLINPPSPERLGSPLLGQQYVAAALLRAGHEVRVADAAARARRTSTEDILRLVGDFQPDVAAFGLFTRWIWHAYGLAAELQGRVPCLMAGGAHTTVRPHEVLRHGFDVALAGEAEETVLAALDAVAGKREWTTVAGAYVRNRASGDIITGPPPAFVADLDSLADPFDAQHLYDGAWYAEHGANVAPGGILTSRGCPARCTFCANYVTGRGFRFRSAACVVRELNEYNARSRQCFFPCWDDALTANTPRLIELCQKIESDIRFPFTWSAITRATMVRPELLRSMKAAGLMAVNFGVESGDNEILRLLKKGVTTEHVVRALEWAKEAGFRTACNFMLGFPQESPHALENTIRFMDRIAPLVDTFSTLGVVVPFPGTPLYDDYHFEYGFTDWWLKEKYSHYCEMPHYSDLERFNRHYIDDTNLELDFFRYTPEKRALIRDALRFKGEHNLRKMGLLLKAQPAA